MSFNKKLVHLCELVTSNQASTEEVAELEQLLQDEPAARQVYLDWAALQVDLSSIVSVSQQREVLIERMHAAISAEISSRNRGWYIALAAAILVSFFLGDLYLSEKPDVTTAGADKQSQRFTAELVSTGSGIDGMAVVNRVDNVSWSQDAKAFQVGRLLKSLDWIEIDSGTLEIEFGQGAVVVLQGPAKFSAKSTSAGILHRGKLAAIVPPWAGGFRIDTPAFEVVDRGTQFVVEVSSEQVNVGVTNGEVEVSHRDQPETSERIEFKHSLFAGKAIRASGGNLLETSLDIHWSSLSEQLPQRPSHNDVEVIARYRRDFVSGIANKCRREGNWRYFANRWFSLRNTEGYVELRWDSNRRVFDPNGDKFKNAGRLYAANLSYRGGHPGQGRDQSKDDIDHYVIAAYRVPSSGEYRIESGWLVRAESREDLNQQTVDLRVRVNGQSDVIHETCNQDGLLRFQGDLGLLEEGDWIYVAVGPQGVSFNDRFEWDFAIVKKVPLVDSI